MTVICNNPLMKFDESLLPSDARTPSKFAAGAANVADIDSLIARSRRGEAVGYANARVLLDEVDHF